MENNSRQMSEERDDVIRIPFYQDDNKGVGLNHTRGIQPKDRK